MKEKAEANDIILTKGEKIALCVSFIGLIATIGLSVVMYLRGLLPLEIPMDPMTIAFIDVEVVTFCSVSLMAGMFIGSGKMTETSDENK